MAFQHIPPRASSVSRPQDDQLSDEQRSEAGRLLAGMQPDVLQKALWELYAARSAIDVSGAGTPGLAGAASSELHAFAVALAQGHYTITPDSATSSAAGAAASATTTGDPGSSTSQAASTSMDPEAEWITFPQGVFLMGIPQRGSTLLVRSHYKRMWELMQAGISSKERLGWVVTGSPGCGKSFFGFYCAIMLAQHKQLFVYQQGGDEPNEVTRFSFDFRADTPLVLESSAQGAFTGADYRGTYLLSDDIVPATQAVLRPILVFTSPKPKQIRHFTKDSTVSTLYMPLNSYGELVALAARCHQRLSLHELDQRYKLVGGVAREVLTTNKSYDTLKAEVKGAVNSLSASTLQHMVEVVNVQDQGFDEACHRLVHYQVEDNGTYASAALVPATLYVSKLMVVRMEQLLAASWQNIVVGAQGVAAAGAFRGALFEAHCHRTFWQQRGKASFRMRQLQPPALPGGKRSHTCSSSPVDQSYEFPVDMQRKAYRAKSSIPTGTAPPTYWRPIASNQGAWDAVLVDGSMVNLFQMTVGSTHPVMLSLIRDTAKLCQPTPLTIRLVFVVPSHLYEQYNWQRWLSKKGEELQRISEEVQVEQWVLDSRVRRTSDASE